MGPFERTALLFQKERKMSKKKRNYHMQENTPTEPESEVVEVAAEEPAPAVEPEPTPEPVVEPEPAPAVQIEEVVAVPVMAEPEPLVEEAVKPSAAVVTKVIPNIF